jgi:hypothetical protein
MFAAAEWTLKETGGSDFGKWKQNTALSVELALEKATQLSSYDRISHG